jgi:hypothetical protein
MFINAASKPARFAIAATRGVTESATQRRLELRAALRNFGPGQFCDICDRTG